MNNSPSFSDIPNEILYTVSNYLSVVENYHLSQTSIHLRSCFHPLLFQRCRVLGTTTTSAEDPPKPPPHYLSEIGICEWPIPLKVLLSPNKYSWFGNKYLKVLFLNPTLDLQLIKKNVNFSVLYPRLDTVLTDIRKVVRFNHNLLLVDSKHVLQQHQKQQEQPVSIYSEQALVDLPNRIHALKNESDIIPAKIVWYRNEESSLLDKVSNTIINCYNASDIKQNINWLHLHLTEAQNSPDSFLFCSSILLDLTAFPNLYKLSIESNDGFCLTHFKSVIQSLPKCPKLDILEISHINTIGVSHLQLLDNLLGSWKLFHLHLENFLPLNFKLRLPSVTSLDASRIISPNLTFEFGPKLVSFFYPLAIDDSHHFEINNTQQLLENLTVLSIMVNRVLDTVTEYGEHHIFTNSLPKLKFFKLYSMHSGRDSVDESAHQFMLKAMLNTVNFGDFDIFNVDHVESFVKEITDMYKTKKGSITLSSKNHRITDADINFPSYPFPSSTTTTTTFSKINDIFTLYLQCVEAHDFISAYKQFHLLQLVALHENYNQMDYQYHIGNQISFSFLFIRIFQFLPNLERLSFDTLSSIEEFPTLHRLIKYHPKLKSVHVDWLKHPPVSHMQQQTNDEFYDQLRQFIMPFEQFESFVTLGHRDRTAGVVIDTEALRKKYRKIEGYLELADPENKKTADNYLLKFGETTLRFHMTVDLFDSFYKHRLYNE